AWGYPKTPARRPYCAIAQTYQGMATSAAIDVDNRRSRHRRRRRSVSQAKRAKSASGKPRKPECVITVAALKSTKCQLRDVTLLAGASRRARYRSSASRAKNVTSPFDDA